MDAEIVEMWRCGDGAAAMQIAAAGKRLLILSRYTKRAVKLF